jgi:SAM-dependent methyltransferase
MSAGTETIFEHEGYCSCCRQLVNFRATAAKLRDFYLCTNCGSIPRNRHLQFVLDTEFDGWEDMYIHEGSQGRPYIQNFSKHYSQSSYIQGAEPGSIVNGRRCENLEGLTFADNTFDIFITQDVLEHVFRPELAMREIMRVLRPGGAHVFTVPKHKGLLEHVQRARMGVDGSIEYLVEPRYHGAPDGEDRALVTWDYGYDFELTVSEWCNGAPVQTFRTLDRTKAIDALFNEVFVMRKPDPSTPLKLFVPTLPTDFDAEAYLAINPDVAAAGIPAADHYLNYGWKENRPLR